MEDKREFVLEYMKDYHNTEAAALSAAGMCELFNLTKRQVRLVVNSLRQDGEPICSSDRGYWYSRDPRDIYNTMNRLKSQAENMNKAVAGLQKAVQEES